MGEKDPMMAGMEAPVMEPAAMEGMWGSTLIYFCFTNLFKLYQKKKNNPFEYYISFTA